MPLYPAQDAELPAIVDLVNAAYRGDAAARGWTTEAGYIDGPRINIGLLRADLAAEPEAMLLGWRDEADGPLLGCVWLEPATHEAWYLSMLTVRPDLQDRQLGRRLLAEAEAAAIRAGARRLRMTVVNIRDTLIAWYQRRGYGLTGKTRPFPYDDNRFGTPTRQDLSFVVLEKPLP